jgi:nitrous oxidase accessory protein NosD
MDGEPRRGRTKRRTTDRRRGAVVAGALVLLVLAAPLVGTTAAVPTRTTVAAMPTETAVSPGESIQRAVDEADAGDVILVQGGVYDQRVTVDKNVTLRADGDVRFVGKEQLTYEENGTATPGAGPAYGIRLTGGADGATVEGFQVDYYADGILVSGAPENVTIRNNDIRSVEYAEDTSTATFQASITIAPPAGGTVRNLTIAGNELSRREIPEDEGAISYAAGVRFRPAENVRFEDLRIRGNALDSGMEATLGADSTIDGFVFETNEIGSGTFSDVSFDTTEENNDPFSATIRDASIRGNTGNEIFISVGAGRTENVTVRENDIQGISFGGDGATVTDIRVVDNEVRPGRVSSGSVSFFPGTGGRLTDVLVRDNTAGIVAVYTSAGDTYEDVAFVENELSGGGSNLYMDAYGGTVRNVTMSRNTIDTNSQAVYFATYGPFEGSRTTVDGVDIADNEIDIGDDGEDFAPPEAMFVCPCGGRDRWTDVEVTGNIVDLRDAKGDPDLEGTSGGTYGVFFGAYSGIGNPTLESVRFAGNEFRNATTGLYLSTIGSTSYDLAVTDNRITGGEFGVVLFEDDTDGGASGRRLTVEQNVIDSVAERGIGLYGPFTETSGDTFPGIDPAGENVPVTVEVRRNQLSNNGVGVELTNVAPGGVTVRRNNFLSNDGVAVLNEEPTPVDARRNYWNASDGPASATDEALADPVATDRLANGSGELLPADPDDDGLAAVRFVPFVDTPIDLDAPETPSPDPPEEGGDEPVRSRPEPRFVYEGTVDPGVIDPGEEVWVNVTVRNEGDAAGAYDGELGTGFVDLAERPGDLDPGESRRLRFQVSFDDVSINQLFVDESFVGEVKVRQPTPVELSERHLEVEAAYPTRVFATAGTSYEAVAVVQNTDDEAHEFQLTFDRFRTARPMASSTRTEVVNRTIVLRAGERRVVRQELTVDGGGSEPRRAVTFLNGVPVGNMTVLPSDAEALPHGVTTAYTTMQPPGAGSDPQVVAVAHNANQTEETFSLVLTDPAFDPDGSLREQADHLRFESVTVPPGETRRLRVWVDEARSDTGIGHWEVNGIPATVVGEPDRETDGRG